MINRTFTRTAAVLAAAITMTASVVTLTHAEDQPWNLTPHGTTYGTSFYDDYTGTFKVWDT